MLSEHYHDASLMENGSGFEFICFSAVRWVIIFYAKSLFSQ